MDKAEGCDVARRVAGPAEVIFAGVVLGLREEDSLDLSDLAVRGRLLMLAFLLADQEGGRYTSQVQVPNTLPFMRSNLTK